MSLGDYRCEYDGLTGKERWEKSTPDTKLMGLIGISVVLEIICKDKKIDTPDRMLKIGVLKKALIMIRFGDDSERELGRSMVGLIEAGHFEKYKKEFQEIVGN